MSLVLDPQTEQRIQHKLAAGGYSEPAQLINRALDLLESEEAWSDDEKADLDQRLSESMGQIQRGEGIPGDQVRQVLAQLRLARTA
jgi:Arc/MetJ-type ribon-helix-helix transcriptional regulator